MTRFKWLSLLVLALLVSSCGEAFPSADEVLDRERERIAYLSQQDYDSLDAMLSPTLTYTHSTSVLDDKDDFLGTLRSGDVVYRDMRHRDMDVRFVTPRVAILNGLSDVSVTVGGDDREVPLRFTIVYVKEGGEWMFEAWHSVGVPQ